MKDMEIVLAAPGDHEKLLAEIYYKDKFVVQVVHGADDQLMVELPEQTDDWSHISRHVPFDDLIECLQQARERLKGT